MAVSFIALTFACFAQDIIIMIDSKNILAIVTEVNAENIKFKNFYNQNGPESTVSKYDVIAILYENGVRETFFEWYKPKSPTPTRTEKKETDTVQKIVDAPPIEPPVTPPSTDAGNNTPFDKPVYKPTKDSQKLSRGLFIIGGIVAATGIATTYLSHPKIETDYTDSGNTGIYTQVKKHNPVYMIVGGVAGSVCIGAGIYIMKKDRNQLNDITYGQSGYQSLPTRNSYICLNFITTGNGAGIRLTF